MAPVAWEGFSVGADLAFEIEILLLYYFFILSQSRGLGAPRLSHRISNRLCEIRVPYSYHPPKQQAMDNDEENTIPLLPVTGAVGDDSVQVPLALDCWGQFSDLVVEDEFIRSYHKKPGLLRASMKCFLAFMYVGVWFTLRILHGSIQTNSWPLLLNGSICIVSGALDVPVLRKALFVNSLGKWLDDRYDVNFTLLYSVMMFVLFGLFLIPSMDSILNVLENVVFPAVEIHYQFHHQLATVLLLLYQIYLVLLMGITLIALLARIRMKYIIICTAIATIALFATTAQLYTFMSSTNANVRNISAV
jgi:hypothetical protein